MLIIIITWLLTIATTQAQSGLSVSPLFEGKIIPTQRMVETRVKGKMLTKYQLTLFRSVRFKANNKQEINRVHDMIEQDKKKNPGITYTENYSSEKSRSKETLMLQLPKQGNQNRFLCYKRNNEDVTVIYMEGTLNSLDTLRELIK
ncbi:hypothetical protein SAMN05216463_11012 [Xylanibacter ruminicola]|uniref:DUF4252 domain-containing protein n=2 Tax=Xylanibacter ruminicola TaxID=839 RepID=A0A1M6UN34_XYLRU|nr:hypothetical protein SAMN05216463_11012 [Xylanibacter ruminicola]